MAHRWSIFFFYHLVLLADSSSQKKFISSFAGPHICILSKVHNCEVPPPDKITWKYYVWCSHYSPSHPNQLQRFTGNLTGASPLTDDLWVRIA
ncbi:Cell division cycle protein CDT1 [Frankliniella fusca]|uniref:Cell division cycle protein CDT1 n=1 Tax=Frankliniella fusca TaxID=407009 RepID=A0AAE1GR17_9NEOP|nr:Cell division cycle protein CDT1 [Frankliniella fusca]